MREPKREQGCASPGECAVLFPFLTATVPQAAAAAAATAETAAAETPAADTEAQTAQAIFGDSTPGVNSKSGRCASPGENAGRKPQREQGCGSPEERAVLSLPLRATGPQAVAAAAITAAAATAAAEAPAADQKADACLTTAILGDSTPGVSSKHGRCASPGESSSETAGKRTQTAPSRRRREKQGLSESTREIRRETYTPWDKIPGIGEAKNPGPEPPRELYLDRKNGQRDPIRLCTQNGGWVWNVHSAPPLRVAKRATPHEALRNWLAKHEPAMEPDSAEAARQLAKAWEEFPVPQPIRRTRSLPPREMEFSMRETPINNSPPRETSKSSSQPEPPVRKRLRGKTSVTSSPSSPTRFCPADPPDDPASQESEGRPEPYGCWDEIYDVLRKPVLVDRNIPRN